MGAKCSLSERLLISCCILKSTHPNFIQAFQIISVSEVSQDSCVYLLFFPPVSPATQPLSQNDGVSQMGPCSGLLVVRALKAASASEFNVFSVLLILNIHTCASDLLLKSSLVYLTVS